MEPSSLEPDIKESHSKHNAVCKVPLSNGINGQETPNGDFINPTLLEGPLCNGLGKNQLIHFESDEHPLIEKHLPPACTLELNDKEDGLNVPGTAVCQGNSATARDTEDVGGGSPGRDNIEVTGIDKREFTGIDNRDVTGINNTEVTGIDNTEVTGIDNTEVTGIDNREVTGINNTEVSGIDNTEVTGINNTEVTGINNTEVTGINNTEVTGIDNTEVTGIDNTEVTGIDNTEVTGIDNSEVTGIDTTEVTGIDNTEVTGINNTEVTGIDNTEVTGIDNTEVTGIDNTEVTGIDNTEVTRIDNRGTMDTDCRDAADDTDAMENNKRDAVDIDSNGGAAIDSRDAVAIDNNAVEIDDEADADKRVEENGDFNVKKTVGSDDIEIVMPIDSTQKNNYDDISVSENETAEKDKATTAEENVTVPSEESSPGEMVMIGLGGTDKLGSVQITDVVSITPGASEIMDELGKARLMETIEIIEDSLDCKDFENSSAVKQMAMTGVGAVQTTNANVDSSKLLTKQADNIKKKQPAGENSQTSKETETQSLDDDLEIIGETSSTQSSVQNFSSKGITKKFLINQSSVGAGRSLLLSSSAAPKLMAASPTLVKSQIVAPGAAILVPSGVGVLPGQSTLNAVSPVAPPKPQSSLDQIELIRWEMQNRINTRPKYFKPNASSELGSLAKFLYDIGSDLIKEAVYHELVKIQSKKNYNNKLNDKEIEDLDKLKEMEKELFSTIGHLKVKLKKKCNRCSFQTESANVMFYHKQYPHEDNRVLKCPHCSYSTKQTPTFRLHMEAEHGMQARILDRKASFECDLCPYENNHEQKLEAHKQRCIKQFRPHFNLHPSCLSGSEINICLENIFYKTPIPKHIKLMQQRQAMHQAVVAAAKKKQGELLNVVAQKTSGKLKKLLLPKMMPSFVPQQSKVSTLGLIKSQMQQVATKPNSGRFGLFNNKQGLVSPLTPAARSQQNVVSPASLTQKISPKAPSGDFEVCEICGGYVKDRKALHVHFYYAHQIDLPVNLFERSLAPLYCATCYVRFWTAQGLRKHIESHKEENQTRGVVGKCILCSRQVLNLLLHMRVVHKRELEHYLNALICMFCGLRFTSRPDCEVHIVAAHGVIDITSGTLVAPPTSKPSPFMPGRMQKGSSPANQKQANKSAAAKGSVCVLCNLNFGRNVDLTRHCMRVHHTCMKCGMVVIDKESLMKHRCLPSPHGTRTCQVCGETGFHPAYFVKHIRDKHLRRFSIRVARLSDNVIKKWTKINSEHLDSEQVLVEISDSDEDGFSSNDPQPSSSVASGGLRPKMGPACKTGRIEISNVVSLENKVPIETEIVKEEVIEIDTESEGSDADEGNKLVTSALGKKRKLSSQVPGGNQTSAKRQKLS